MTSSSSDGFSDYRYRSCEPVMQNARGEVLSKLQTALRGRSGVDTVAMRVTMNCDSIDGGDCIGMSCIRQAPRAVRMV